MKLPFSLFQISLLSILFPWQATWHPFQNLIVVGRYPDATLEGFEHDTVRSIDAYDVSSGELVCRLMDQCATGIQSVSSLRSLMQKSYTGGMSS